MRSLVKIALVLVFALLVGFTVMVNEENIAEPVINEYLISADNEVNTADISLVNYEEMGTLKASWYGPGFHGKKTANGEIYDQMSFTVAHKSLKFGTLLRLTNPRNGKTVIARVNDRGPYIEGRDLDLSKATAMALGMVKRGVARLKVEEVKIAGLENPILVN